MWMGGSPARRPELRRAAAGGAPRRCRWPPASSTCGRRDAERGRRGRITASEKAFPGRFLLGIGIGHPEHTEEYRKPYDVLVEYLDALDAAEGADQPPRDRRARAQGAQARGRSAAPARTPT